ncbi:MAG: alpha/beta hydrolase [Acidimicrobiales bacterium]
MLLALSLAAGLCLVAPVVYEILRWRRRRFGRAVAHGWRLVLIRLLSPLLAFSVTGAAIADGVNRHYSYIPTFAALFGDVSPDLVPQRLIATPLAPLAKPPTHGRVEKVAIAGAVSGVGARDAYVYLPPAYFDGAQPTRRFPVLYLLHGSPGIAIDWLRGGYADRTMDQLLLRGRIQPFIVVMPDLNGGYLRDLECEDVVNGPQDQTYVATDVVTWVDQRYRTVADRSARAIGGLSTGGYCGLNLTFRHQDVFSAAVSHSGYGRPDQNRYTGNLFGGSAALFEANSPDSYLATIPIHLPIGVYLDAGAGDAESRKESARLFDVLTSRGVNATFNVVPTESHNFVAWRKNLNLSLPWVSGWFEHHVAPSAQNQVAAPDDSFLPPASPSDQAVDTGPITTVPGRRRPLGPGLRTPTTTASPGASSDGRPRTTSTTMRLGSKVPPPATSPSSAPSGSAPPSSTAPTPASSAGPASSAPPSPPPSSAPAPSSAPPPSAASTPPTSGPS